MYWFSGVMVTIFITALKLYLSSKENPRELVRKQKFSANYIMSSYWEWGVCFNCVLNVHFLFMRCFLLCISCVALCGIIYILTSIILKECIFYLYFFLLDLFFDNCMSSFLFGSNGFLFIYYLFEESKMCPWNVFLKVVFIKSLNYKITEESIWKNRTIYSWLFFRGYFLYYIKGINKNISVKVLALQ